MGKSLRCLSVGRVSRRNAFVLQWTCIAVAIGCLVLSSQAFADTFSLTPVQDSYTSESSPTAVPGAGNSLAYRTAPSGSSARNDIAAIQFDISSVSGVITDASLTLTQNRDRDVAHSLNLIGVLDSVSGGWDENTLAYSNAPWLFTDSDIEEAGEYLYDQWDLVADGDTSPNFRPGVVEVQGTDSAVGISLGNSSVGQVFSFDGTGIGTFLQQAVNNGDSTVTMLVASHSNFLMSVYSKEGAPSAAELPTLAIETTEAPPTQFEVNRNTGAISLRNLGSSTLLFDGYELESNSLGALDQSNWKSIADNYDSDGPNTADSGAMIGSVDSDDEWTKLTQPTSDSDLSEFEFGGNGGMLAAGQAVVLSQGGAWIQTPNETDLSATIALPDSTILEVPVVYTGNGDAALLRSDLDADGDIDADDFEALRANNPADLSSLSTAQSYKLGDIDGDGDNDGADFVLFRSDFIAANSLQAFSAMIAGTSVPEPPGVALVLIVGCCAVATRLRRSRGRSLVGSGRWLAIVCAALTLLAAKPSQAVNLPVAADTYFAEGNDSPESPTTADMRIRYSTLEETTRNQIIALKFDVSSLSNTVVSAGLNLTSQRNHSPNYEMNLFGAFGSVAGDWTQADSTSTWHQFPLMQADNDSLFTEASDFIYDQWDLVPNGDTDDSNLLVQELVGDESGGIQFGGGNIDEDDTITFDDPNIAAFLDSARLASESTVTFLLATRTQSTGEFRLYDEESAPSAAFTPNLDVLTIDEVPRITVNTNNGEIRFVNPTASDIDFAQYQIDSPLGLLETGDSEWESLADRGMDGVDGADPGSTIGDTLGELWAESENVGPNTLAELFLLGNSTVPAGGFISLGSAYDQDALVDDENMTFEYFDINENAIVSAFVELIAPEGLPGDFNDDGVVNLADYTVWRNNLGGSEAALNGNGDDTGGSSGVVDSADYALWKSEFGNSSGAGSLAAGSQTNVPEPGTWALLSIAFVAGVCYRRTRTSVAAVRAAFAMLVAILASQSALAATDDRFYSFGEDGAEAAQVNTTLGSNGILGFTLDSEGPQFGFIDLSVNGTPTYRDVSDRPGAGSTLGAEFDGPGSGDFLSAIISTSSPDFMWDNTDTFFTDPQKPFPRNYSGLFGYGMQAWVKPNSATQNVRQDIVNNTEESAIYITPSNTWGLRFDGGDRDSGQAVAFNTWTHVQGLAGAFDTVGGSSRQGGVLLVNGEAVAGSTGSYEDSDNGITIGGNLNGDGAFYHGIIDEFHLSVWGDTSDETGPPVGEDFGAFNPAEDNEWIMRELASLGVTDAADANMDGSVTPADVNTLAANWKNVRVVGGVQIGDWMSRQQGDLNWDGEVDIRDAVILDQALSGNGFGGVDFGALLGGGTTVPEPSTIALAALAVVVLRVNRGRHLG